MSLRRKILLLLFGALALLVPATLVISSGIVLDSFRKAEQTSVQRHIDRLEQIVAAEASALEIHVVDWGAWDDTFQYVADRNADFEKSNFGDTSIANLRMDVIAFTGADGEIVFGTGFDQKAGVSKSLPQGLRDYLKRPGSFFVRPEKGTPLSGVVVLPEGALVMAAHPVTRTDGTGPARGYVLFGRWMNGGLTARIEKLMRVPVSMVPLDGADLPEDFRAARAAFAEGASVFQRTVDDDRLAVFTCLKDLQGRRTLVVGIKVPREIYAEGRLSIWNLIVTVLVFALVFTLVVLLSMRRLVLDRVQMLTSGVGRIRSQSDLSERMPVTGADELSGLTVAINQMLGSLEKSEEHQVRVDAALALEKERLAVTLRSMGEGVAATDVAGNVVLINKAAEEMTGWFAKEAAGQPLWKIFRAVDARAAQPLREMIGSVVVSGRPYELPPSTLLVSRNGLEVGVAGIVAPVVDRAGGIVGSVLVFRDTTAARRIEEERLRANKLESVGLLAGGIAHDFNNALTAILSNNMLASLSAGTDPELRAYLADTERACIRARSLTQQLLTFARGGAPVKKPADIGALLHEAGRFAVRGTNVRCNFDIPHGLAAAEVDEGQIVQIVQNLVINAVQAMPDGGNVHITARNQRVEEPLGALQPGDTIAITVRDEGCGIPPENLPRIFDPYFTTKRKGTGLGLATAYSIVHNHGGHISVESNVNSGTTFTIHLPALPNEVPAPSANEADVWAGKLNVLLMDDDEIILRSLETVLTKLGCTVKTSTEGRAALDACRNAIEIGRPFDLVIMDLTVPAGMGGLETAARIRALDPETSIVVSSGYSNDPVMSDHAAHGFNAVLPKPFTMQDLSALLRSVAPRNPREREPSR